MKSFGGIPRGARLERIKASPRWAGERFRNVHPVMPGLRDPNASMPTIREFLCDGERRTPRRPLPSMNPLAGGLRSEEHTSELQSQSNLVCRLLLEKKKKKIIRHIIIQSREPYRQYPIVVTVGKVCEFTASVMNFI